MEPGGIEGPTVSASQPENADFEGVRATGRASESAGDLEVLAELVKLWPQLSQAARSLALAFVRGEAAEAARKQTHGSFAHESSDTPDGRSHARKGVPCEHGRGVDRRGSGAEEPSEPSAAGCGSPAAAARRQGPSPDDSGEVSP